MPVHALLLGARPPQAAVSPPPALSAIGSVTLLEVVLGNLTRIPCSATTLALSSEDIARWHVPNAVGQLSDEVDLLEVKRPTAGAACTALLAIDLVDADAELLILAADEFVITDYAEILDQFRSQDFDAGTIIFDSVQPRFSFVRLEDHLVVQAAEKDPISRNATAGFYWFRKAGRFFEMAGEMIAKRATVGGRYYVCPVFNELVLEGARVGVVEVPEDTYVPVKNPADAISAAARLMR